MSRFKVYFVPEQARWGIRYFYLWPLFWSQVPHVWDTKEGAEMAKAGLEEGKTYDRREETK